MLRAQGIKKEADFCPRARSRHCGLRFLSSTFHRDQIDEGSRVSQLQHEEDHELFGAREIPVDAYGGTEPPFPEQLRSTDRSETPKKDLSSIPERRYTVESTPEPRFPDNSSDQLKRITPLHSWFTSLEPPNAPPTFENVGHGQHLLNETTPTSEHQQVEDFRIISIKARPVPRSEVPRVYDVKNAKEVDGAEDMPFAARIYYRNILDRFPHISKPLARRYADANLRRSEKLGISRAEIEGYIEANPNVPHLTPGNGRLNVQAISSSSEASLSPEPDSVGAIDTQEIQSREPSSSGLSTHVSQSEEDNVGVPELSFWTGRARSLGPRSSASQSSSRNSSLQSGDAPGYKPPSISIASTRSSMERPLPNMVLPPPPVELGSQKSFVCDICRQTVFILRRKEWR